MFKTITQGGQVHIHQLRMFKQIFVFGFLLACLTGGGYFVWRCFQLQPPLWRAALEITKAKLLLATTFAEKEKTLTQTYTPPNFLGTPTPSYRRRSLDIVHDKFLQEKVQELTLEIKIAGLKGLGIGGLSFLLLMLFWLKRGGSHRKTQHQRGSTFMASSKLKKTIQKTKQASDITVADFPLIKDKETSHTLITGTTGAGKTNLFHIFLPQLRRRGDRAIVVDVTGDYIARYYNEQTDIILNPLDARSLLWSPWADCQLDSHYDVLANALIQPKDRSNSDPFWDNASRAVLKASLRKFANIDHTDVEDLYQFLMTSSNQEFCQFFKGTEAASVVSQSNEKTTTSIRSVLASQIEGLRYLETPSKDDAVFSLRNWVEHVDSAEDKGWVFLTARPDQRKTLTPLISTWVDIAINALMTLPQNPNRRLWFIMDELTALQKLPCLQLGLAEARKYGGCFLVGFQSKPQLEAVYGDKTGSAMLDLFNTKFFFRCTEPSTQVWISKILGDKEEAEPTSTISYGAHSMRDGVSLAHHTRHKPLVMPAELSQLEDLECYLKLPGNYPCTRLQMTVQKPIKELKVPFILIPEKKKSSQSPVLNFHTNQDNKQEPKARKKKKKKQR